MLVVLEGVDGSGKTTLAQGLVRTLTAEGHSVIATREPTDGPHGRRIREAATAGRRFSAEQELELFMADRADHVRERVRPALQRGDVVVQDRTFYSTAAYQGLRGLDPEAILAQGRRIAPEPDVLLVLDLPVERALQRIHARGAGIDAFERREALERIADFFSGLVQAVHLDATLPQDELLEAALQTVRARLSPPGPQG